MMWFNRNVTTLNSTLQLLNMLVANSCDVQKQPLNEFQEQKKKKKRMILKEIAKILISQVEENNVVLFISFFV